MIGAFGCTFSCLGFFWFPNCLLPSTSLLALLPANDLDAGKSTCLLCLLAVKSTYFFTACKPSTQVEQEPRHLFVGRLLGSVDCWFYQTITRSLGTILPSIRIYACRGVDFLLLKDTCSGSGAILYRSRLAAEYPLGNSVGAIESVVMLLVSLALSK